MPANVSVEYTYAEKRYLSAKTDEEKLKALEEMLSQSPSHKGAENLRADLKSRIKRLREKLEEKKAKSRQARKEGIKKAELQACLIGLDNSGKSSILASLTNAKPEISDIQFTTKQEIIGTLDYENVKIQIIDLPAIESEYFNQGIANTSDVLLIVITKISDLEEISKFLEKAPHNRLIILNKIDLLSEQEKRKFQAFLQSRKYNFILFSAETHENINDLRKKIWESFNKIRVYTKEPGKPFDSVPVIMQQDSAIKQLAEKIFHSHIKIKEARVTGPSSKFPNQKTSLEHVLKDKDIVEFRV